MEIYRVNGEVYQTEEEAIKAEKSYKEDEYTRE